MNECILIKNCWGTESVNKTKMQAEYKIKIKIAYGGIKLLFAHFRGGSTVFRGRYTEKKNLRFADVSEHWVRALIIFPNFISCSN